jgi:hypothetical protein
MTISKYSVASIADRMALGKVILFLDASLARIVASRKVRKNIRIIVLLRAKFH